MPVAGKSAFCNSKDAGRSIIGNVQYIGAQNSHTLKASVPLLTFGSVLHTLTENKDVSTTHLSSNKTLTTSLHAGSGFL